MIKKITRKNDTNLLFLDGESVGPELEVVPIMYIPSFLTNDMIRHTPERAKVLQGKGEKIHGQYHWLMYIPEHNCFGRLYTSTNLIEPLARPIENEVNRLFVDHLVVKDKSWSRFQFQVISGEPVEMRPAPEEEFEAAHLEDIRISNARD